MTTSQRELLVVNDDGTQLHLAASILERAGFRVYRATDVPQALTVLDARTGIEGVVTDLHMPGIDGWRFCRLLRSPAYAAFNDVPVLVLSATFSGFEAEILTRQLGANGFLAAPYAPAALVRSVDAMLAGTEAPTPIAALLAVADDAECASLGKAFRAHGHETHQARDAAGIRGLLKMQSPAVVVLDDRMAGPALAEVIADVHAPAPAVGTVVLVLLSGADPATPLELMRAGADACISRPWSDHAPCLCQTRS
jgi:DNA-binding response OmpR family regulator